MKIKKVLALALGVALSGVAASAATYSEDGTCSITVDVDPDATDCFGLSGGNVQQLAVNTDTFGSDLGLFGYTDWVEIQKDEDFEGDPTGSFTIAANSYTMVSVLLKSADEWSAYLFDGGLSGEISFFTANDRGLSNYLVVGRDVSEIPLPATGLLLVGGLAGLGWMRRRKAA